MNGGGSAIVPGAHISWNILSTTWTLFRSTGSELHTWRMFSQAKTRDAMPVAIAVATELPETTALVTLRLASLSAASTCSPWSRYLAKVLLLYLVSFPLESQAAIGITLEKLDEWYFAGQASWRMQPSWAVPLVAAALICFCRSSCFSKSAKLQLMIWTSWLIAHLKA